MNILKKEIVSIQAAALLIGAAGFLSRILGLFRDRLLAAHFGASRELDIYYAAFQIPDFIYTVFLVGSATAAIIPVLLEYWERDRTEARRMIESLFWIFLVLSSLFCLMVIAAAPYIVRHLVPGFSAEEQRLTVFMTQIMMASPLLLSVSNIVSGVIQANRRFFSFSLSAIFYNLGIIFGIKVFLPLFGLVGLSYGVIVGALLHFLVQLPAYFNLGFGLYPRLSFHPGIRRIVFLSVPRVLALSCTAISIVVVNAIASTLAPGSISVFQFSRNIQSIPVGIFGISFAVAVFPRLVEGFIKKDGVDFYGAFFGTLKTVIFWLAPISVLFFVLRAQLVRLLLGTGHFDWQDTRLTAAVLGIFSLVIILDSVTPLFIKSFYALNKTTRPLVISVASAALTIVLSLLFSRYFAEPTGHFPGILGEILKVDDFRDLGVLGIALSIVIGQTVNFFFLYRWFMDEARATFGFIPKNGFLRSIGVFITAALISGIASYEMLRVLNLLVTLDTFFGVFVQGVGAGLFGLAFYGSILYFLGNKEMLESVEIFRRRLFKNPVLPVELDGESTPVSQH